MKAIASSAFIYGLYVVYNYLFHGVEVVGWTSLIVSIYLLSGVIIVILGVLGIYIGKVFDETKGRPLYIVSKKVGI